MKFAAIFLLLSLLAQNAFASTLVFKVTKDLKTREFVEIGTFNAAKFGRLRIQIKNTHLTALTTRDWADFQIEICGVEGDEESCDGGHQATLIYRDIIEVPPPKVRIKISGRGTFQVFVWGQ